MSKVNVMFLVLALLVPVAFAADVSKPAEPRRMLVLPADAYRAIVAEEAKLNATLANCRKAADPKTCRSNAMTAYGQRVSAILDEVRTPLRWGRGPATNMDCFGDSRARVQATCGGEVEQIPVPCTHCDPMHVQKTGGKCFLWVCVNW